MQVLHKGLHAHVVENIGDQYKGIAVKLVLKEPSGRLIGGATGYTTINNLILECLWVDEAYRGLGLGRRLLTEAETKAKNEGCIACQTMSLSFQAPGFFQKMGYQVYGVSDSYPEPVIESHFVKFFD
jgi:GNAT superfamily N-acetyltransferase